MNIKARLNKLEHPFAPQPVAFVVYMPPPDETEEERQRWIAQARAEGREVYEVRMPSPTD